MRSRRPEGYVNPTEMTHSVPTRSLAGQADATTSDEADAAPAPTAERDAKRVEKIRGHASSRRTAGAVVLDT